jgi:hypothetical protein
MNNRLHRILISSSLMLVLAAFSLAGAVHAQQQPLPSAAGYGHWKKPGQAPNTSQPGAPAETPVTKSALPPASSGPAPTGKKTAAGEQFYIIASLDLAKSQLLLKLPSEVTLLMNVAANTQIRDENGGSLKLSDLRAGDTVWVVASSGAEPNAIHIRKGQMTVADLHRYYLDYPEIK